MIRTMDRNPVHVLFQLSDHPMRKTRLFVPNPLCKWYLYCQYSRDSKPDYKSGYLYHRDDRFYLFHHQPMQFKKKYKAVLFFYSSFKKKNIKFTLLRMDTDPFAIPSARYCPSLAQAQQLIREITLIFCTAFCSLDQKAKSD